MCGLAGIAGGRPTLRETAQMLGTIRHRGPDETGFHISGNTAVGHVRLAIVDPTEAGSQPMLTPDERFCLVYNGEIYNHLDFRPDLQQRGVKFRGHSDTETLLWLLAIHGERILPKLNGIFSLAFIDTTCDRVLLARDPLGVKPLYYATGRGGRLLFGSEIKALLATGEVEPRMNTDDLAELFMFHFISGDRTAFSTVRELKPGHYFVVDSRGAMGAPKQYWSPVPQEVRMPNDCGCEILRGLVHDGITRQLMSDVPVGIMSSGGLDSGILTAVAGPARAALNGFCYRDPGNGYDELEAARETASGFGVPVSEVRVDDAELPDLLMKLAWHYDEPLPRPHQVAAFAVARQAGLQGFKVLISGEGGDELFGGYSRYGEVAASFGGSEDDRIVFGHNRVAVPRIARFWPQVRFGNPYRFDCARLTTGLDVINRQLLVDQLTFLQHFLQRSDRMGMAAGVEVRVPLLDVPLVEFTNRLPGSCKVAGAESKRCLKAAMTGVVAPSLLRRSKQAFELPMAPLLLDGPVASMLDDLLLSRPRVGELFDRQTVAKIVSDLRGGDHDLWKIVWLLLTTEIWMRTFNVTI